MLGAEMSCKQLVEVITDYLEGTLPEPDRARFEAHLDECPGCVAYLDQMRQTVRVVGRLTTDTLSEGARGELLNLFRGWNRGK